MRLINHFRFRLSRRKSNKVEHSYNDIVEYKKRHFQRYSDRYQTDQKFQHQDKYYEQYVYGHSCLISGLTPNTYQSLRYAKSMMKYAKPNLLLLGGISDNYLRLQQHRWGIRHHYEHPQYRPEKMQCKERISRILQERLQRDPDLLWNELKKEMTTINHNDKRIVPNEYLTVAQMATIQQHTKVAIAKPSDTLVFQDLIMRFSLEELKEIAERAIQKVRQNQPNQVSWRLSYTREAIQSYIMSEQPVIHSRELTYQAALLKRYAKIQDRILMFVPGYFADRIASQVHQVDIKPENVFRNGLNDRNSETYAQFQKIMHGDPQTVLQKFCLLSMIKQSWIQHQFANGINVFRYMCFGKLFENMDMDELMERYIKAKRATEGKWYELIQQRVNNIHILPGPHIRLTLSQQFQLLEQRATKHFPYTYQQKNYLSQHQDNVKLAQVQQKMRDILNEEGDTAQIQLFDKFVRGFRSKEGIILYSKLLGKANIQSYDRIKLPIFHYGAFRGIFKEYLRDFLLRGEQNSKLDSIIKSRQQKIQDMMQKHMKKLDDPNQIHKYVTGKMGKTFQVSLDPQDGPQFQIQDIQGLKKVFGEMKPEDQQELREQFGDDWDKIDDQMK